MDDVQFPYMFWAHEEAIASPYCLSQSGMPAPEASFLEGRLALDFAHPCAEAQPAVEARLAELFGVEPERVLVTVGASSAMLIAAMRWFRPGARVVTESPSYEPFRRLPPFFGAELRVVRRRVEQDWRLDLGAVREHLAESQGPGHVFLSNPNNPSGALETAATQIALAEAAARAGGVLVSNEVYMEFARPGERLHAFALAPNAVSIGSLTKAYGLGALRVGWIVFGEGLVEERRQVADMSYLAYVDPPTLPLRAARVALDHLGPLLGHYRRYEAESRPHLERWLLETPGVEAHLPALGLSAFPRLEGVTDARAFAAHMASELQVDVVPGEYFDAPGHLRLSFGVPEATLSEGLARLTRGLEFWRATHS